MYGGKTIFALVGGAILATGLLASPAEAVQWTFSGNGSGSSEKTYTTNESIDELKARGYYTSNSDGSGRYRTASVATWSNGIGWPVSASIGAIVKAPVSGVQWNDPWSSSKRW